jgi:ribosomal protein S18 acetylase RimI-like enzyme
MEIRFLKSDDAAEYWRLRLEALEGDPNAFTASAEEHKSLSLDEVRRRIGDANGENFIVGAFNDGRLAGTVGFFREKGLKTRHKGGIWGVYVTPEQRGAGVGKKMMEMALARAEQIDGIEQVLISVATTQIAAEKLYRSLGFQPFGREPRAVRIGDEFIDEIYLVLHFENKRKG